MGVGHHKACRLPRASRAEKMAFPLSKLVRSIWKASLCFRSQPLKTRITFLLTDFLLAGPRGQGGGGHTWPHFSFPGRLYSMASGLWAPQAGLILLSAHYTDEETEAQ